MLGYTEMQRRGWGCGDPQRVLEPYTASGSRVPWLVGSMVVMVIKDALAQLHEMCTSSEGLYGREGSRVSRGTLIQECVRAR